MMKASPTGIYVHVPFCIKKCAYCDFCSFPISSFDSCVRERYIDALINEISSYREHKISVDTVFIGGGTPSLLTPDELLKIKTSIDESFCVMPNAEFTVEVNPATDLKSKILDFKSLGVNRISIGLQSIHENELKILGRIHSYSDFFETYDAARRAGVDNINVDLMYAIPEQTVSSFDATLSSVLSLSPEHISLYSLILEENTPLWKRRQTLALPDEDKECEMYYSAADKLRGAGYSHYEISNYALQGRECKHNLKYWHTEDYIGVGLAAHSFFRGVRYANTSVLENYIKSGTSDRIEELISGEDRRFEYAMLHLRLARGFSLSEYKKLFGVDFILPRRDLVEKFVEGGYLIYDGERIFLSEKGFYLSNYILSALL